VSAVAAPVALAATVLTVTASVGFGWWVVVGQALCHPLHAVLLVREVERLRAGLYDLDNREDRIAYMNERLNGVEFEDVSDARAT
jgi:hypothetical protein